MLLYWALSKLWIDHLVGQPLIAVSVKVTSYNLTINVTSHNINITSSLV